MTREEKYLKVNNIIKDIERGMSKEQACKKANLKIGIYLKYYQPNMEMMQEQQERQC